MDSNPNPPDLQFAGKERLDRELCYIFGQHRGEQNAIEHRALVERVARIMSVRNLDRQVRAGIERLRRRGWLVANTQSGAGYYLAESPEEYQTFRAVYVSHALPILETAKAMDRTAAERWRDPLQPSLFGGGL